MKIVITCILSIVLFSVSFDFLNQELPEGFVYVQDLDPTIEVELRYFTTNNFVGDTIDFYKSNKLILSKPTAEALIRVQEELTKKNLCLLVYDGYRPQGAVNHFIKWARDLNDTVMKQQFYPNVEKRNLFNEGYIASKSGHSRGSTVDLTIIDAGTGNPLDMGSPYDFFGPESWVENNKLTETQIKNRKLLQEVMINHGFRNYPKEWWHFTLRDEPYPNTYFEFPIE